MARNRLELQKLLEQILGSRNVYFQPPTNLVMEFPCIVYTRSNSKTVYADNKKYVLKKCYQVTLINSDPDSKTLDKLELLDYCQFDRQFKSENLYHTVYKLYF